MTTQSKFPIDGDSAAQEKWLDRSLKQVKLHSVFDAAGLTRDRFVSRHGPTLGESAAEHLHDASVARASLLARHHCEQVLHDLSGARVEQAPAGIGRAEQTKQVPARTAIGAAVASLFDDLPTYDALFKEAWASFCRPGAIESLDSPVAYLTDLYKLVGQIEADAGSSALCLASRRPDLARLRLDDDAAQRELPTLELVNRILRDAIESKTQPAPGKKAASASAGDVSHGSPQATLATARYPFNLPFDWPTRQILGGLQSCRVQWGDLIREADPRLPAFVPAVDGSSVMPHAQHVHPRALQAYSGLGPEQQKLLAEPPAFATGALLANVGATLEGPDVTAMQPWSGQETHAYRCAFRVPPQTGVTVPGGENLDQIVAGRSAQTHSVLAVTCQAIDAQGQLHPDETVQVTVHASAREGELARPVNNANSRKGKPYQRRLFLEVKQIAGQKAGRSYVGAVRFIAAQYQGPSFAEMTYGIVVPGQASDPTLIAALDYCERHYGLPLVQSGLSGGTHAQVDVNALCGSAGITRAELDQLLCVHEHAPVVSPHCPSPNGIFGNGRAADPFPAPYHYGAVYLHGGLCECINGGGTDAKPTLELGAHRLDRLNRLIRLRRWLGLPPDKVDLLLSAIARAEGVHNLALTANANTVRALGLFRHWQQAFGVDADAFAAFIHRVSPFAVGSEMPFFDRLFNAARIFDAPLVLDGKSFDTQATSGDDARTVKQICAGLGIAETTFARLVPLVRDAQQGSGEFALPELHLRRSLSIISALYRLVAVPRLFGLSVEAGLTLLDLMDGNRGQFKMRLAGEPVIHPLDAAGRPTATGTPDSIDVLLAFEAAAAWLRGQADITPSLTLETLAALLKHDAPPLTNNPRITALLDSLAQLVQAMRVDDALLARHGVPAIGADNQRIDWKARLAGVRDADGLILPAMRDDEALAARVDSALVELDAGESPAALRAKLLGCLTEARNAQVQAVNAVLAKETGVANQMPSLLLRWLGSNEHAVLAAAMHHVAGHAPRPGDLDLLADFTRHAAAVTIFKLSAAAVTALLEHPTWFGVQSAAPHNGPALSLRLCYLLSRYAELLGRTPQDEDHVLAYLAHANAETGGARAAAAASAASHRLLADLLAWDAAEIERATQACGSGKACSLADLDALMRMQRQARQSGLRVDGLQLAAALAPDGEFAARQALGNAVMAAARTRSAQSSH